MNNEIREKDHEWVKMFHSNIDRLLVSIDDFPMIKAQLDGIVKKYLGINAA